MIQLNKPLVDYLTLVFKNEGLKVADQEDFMKIQMDGEGATIRWFSGYKLDGVFVGSGFHEGKNYLMLDVPGASAHEWARLVKTKIKPTDEQVNCSRVDIQITIEEPSGYDAVKMHQELIQRETRACPIAGDMDNGYTVYIGSKSSDRRIRIYEKIAQKGKDSEERFLRFEIQYRRELAEQIWLKLFSGGDIGDMIKGEVNRVRYTRASSETGRICRIFNDVLSAFDEYSPRFVKGESDTLEYLERMTGTIARMLNSDNNSERVRMISIVFNWFAMVESSVLTMKELHDE